MQKAQKRIQTKCPRSPSKNVAVSEQPLAKKQKGDEPETQQQLTPAAGAKKASGTAFRSGVWQWFSELRIEGVRHGICIVEMADGKPCGAKIRSGDSTTSLWWHLKTQHGYTGNAKRVRLNMCLILSISLINPFK